MVVLVAIAVILSSITLFGVSQFTGTTQNAQAGVSIDYESESIIDVQLNNIQTADKVLVKSAFGTGYSLSDVGDSVQLLNAETNTTPTVIGVRNGERTVLQQVPPQSFEPDVVVGDSTNADYSEIQNAIDEAGDGDIVVIERDEYEVSGLTIDSEVTLVGESGTQITDTRPDGSGTISVQSDNAIVSNLDINANDNKPYGISTTGSNSSIISVAVTNATSGSFDTVESTSVTESSTSLLGENNSNDTQTSSEKKKKKITRHVSTNANAKQIASISNPNSLEITQNPR